MYHVLVKTLKNTIEHSNNGQIMFGKESYSDSKEDTVADCHDICIDLVLREVKLTVAIIMYLPEGFIRYSVTGYNRKTREDYDFIIVDKEYLKETNFLKPNYADNLIIECIKKLNETVFKQQPLTMGEVFSDKKYLDATVFAQILTTITREIPYLRATIIRHGLGTKREPIHYVKFGNKTGRVTSGVEFEAPNPDSVRRISFNNVNKASIPPNLGSEVQTDGAMYRVIELFGKTSRSAKDPFLLGGHNKTGGIEQFLK